MHIFIHLRHFPFKIEGNLINRLTKKQVSLLVSSQQPEQVSWRFVGKNKANGHLQ